MKIPWLLALSLIAANGAELAADDPTELHRLVDPAAKLEKLATGMKFTEGPVWVEAEGGYLVFSDIPANELKRWSPGAGLATFRQPSGNANGNTLDRNGNLVSCEHSGRRLSSAKGSAKPETLVDSWEGKPFNSPNDAAVKRDGTIFFTDPDYGLGGKPSAIGGCYVFRYDPKTRQATVLAKDFDKPNGICLSPDEKRLYVADSGKPRHIRVFDLSADNQLSNGRVFCAIDAGGPDGIRCDAEGRVWSSARDGIHIFRPSGERIGKILVPETPANLCFGDKQFQTLFITARTSLYSIPIKVMGKR
jgi:gluconolactonase